MTDTFQKDYRIVSVESRFRVFEEGTYLDKPEKCGFNAVPVSHIQPLKLTLS